MYLFPVTEKEVIETTKEFHSGKAVGYDNIPMSIIQQVIETISKPLSHIINLSLTYGIVPDQLKISRVVPLFKAGDKSNLATTDQFRSFPLSRNYLKEHSIIVYQII